MTPDELYDHWSFWDNAPRPVVNTVFESFVSSLDFRYERVPIEDEYTLKTPFSERTSYLLRDLPTPPTEHEQMKE